MSDGAIGHDPTQGVKKPKIPHKEARFHNLATVERIASRLSRPNGLWSACSERRGCAGLNQLGLEQQQVNLDQQRLLAKQTLGEIAAKLIVTNTKSHTSRTVPLTPIITSELRSHLISRPPGDTVAVFGSPNGYRLRYSNWIHRIWRPVLVGLGLPQIGVHIRRHSAAATMIHVGASPKAVQQVLGHASAMFTLTVCGHIFEDELDEITERTDELWKNLPRPHRGLEGTHSSSGNEEIVCNLGFLWSGRRGSNPRPSPWQGDALPTELRPLVILGKVNRVRNATEHCRKTRAIISGRPRQRHLILARKQDA